MPGLGFVARQPSENVFGYELLCRDGLENYFQSSDADAASRSTVDSSLLIGLDLLCDGPRAFVNCTRDVLLKDYVTLLPSHQTMVEVLESVQVDEPVLTACQGLKEAGYLIALDDFGINDSGEHLIELCDIIKVDMRATSAVDRVALLKRQGPWPCRMLAEKVETGRNSSPPAIRAFFIFNVM